MKLDLHQFLRKKERVLSGRERGREVRKIAKLEEMERSGEKIIVMVPKEVYSLNASFFLGLFGPSIRSMGEKEFRARYEFVCDPLIRRNIDDGISHALKESDVLRGFR